MIEVELLGRLRANPLDRETREVYADWLEQQGQTERAAFLRATDLASRREHAIADPSGGVWRAIVTEQPIARCTRLFRQACAMPWQQLATTDNDLVRHCATCDRDVFYCATLPEAEYRRNQCIAIDLALDENAAKDLYDRIVPLG